MADPAPSDYSRDRDHDMDRDRRPSPPPLAPAVPSTRDADDDLYRRRDDRSPRRDGPPSASGSAPRDRAPPPAKPGNAPAAEPSNVLGVFGLSIRTQERDLYNEFSRSGQCDKAVIVVDQRTGRSRGFGFVTMGSVDDAQRGIDDMNGVDLHGRRIRVDFSATRRPHEPTPGEYRGPKRDDDLYRGPPMGGDRWAGAGGPPPPRGGPYGGGGGGYGGGGYGGGYGGGGGGYGGGYNGGGGGYGSGGRVPPPRDDRWGYGGDRGGDRRPRDDYGRDDRRRDDRGGRSYRDRSRSR
ncbi:hypothetical protein JCM8208_000566, partial [Rhodotorula glutinis]